MNEEDVVHIHELKLHAASLIKEEQYSAAESIYREILDLYDDEDSPGQLGALKIYTRLLLMKGEVAEAITYFERATSITFGIYGDDHLETASACMALASAQRKGNGEQVEESEVIFKEALKIYRKIHGKKTPHSNTAAALLGLGMAMEAQGSNRCNDARQAYENALTMRQTVFGENHQETGDAMICLAALLSRTEEVNAALVAYEKALAIFRIAYHSETHPRVLLCLDSMALLFRRQAKILRSDKLFGEGTVSEMAASRR